MLSINKNFAEVLEPLGADATDFFLAASLYHARKVSFAAAANLSGLSFETFHDRLREHFGSGFIFADEAVLEDLETAWHVPFR